MVHISAEGAKRRPISGASDPHTDATTQISLAGNDSDDNGVALADLGTEPTGATPEDAAVVTDGH
jgi:hypothetical protein